MKKHRLFFVCGLALFMVGCQASQSSKTTEPSKAKQETSVSKEDQVLNRGQWEVAQSSLKHSSFPALTCSPAAFVYVAVTSRVMA